MGSLRLVGAVAESLSWSCSSACTAVHSTAVPDLQTDGWIGFQIVEPSLIPPVCSQTIPYYVVDCRPRPQGKGRPSSFVLSTVVTLDTLSFLFQQPSSLRRPTREINKSQARQSSFRIDFLQQPSPIPSSWRRQQRRRLVHHLPTFRIHLVSSLLPLPDAHCCVPTPPHTPSAITPMP